MECCDVGKQTPPSIWTGDMFGITRLNSRDYLAIANSLTSTTQWYNSQSFATGYDENNSWAVSESD